MAYVAQPAYADDSIFFLKDKNFIEELLNTINYFSSFCEMAG